MTLLTLGICLVIATVSGIVFNVYILSLSCITTQSRTVSHLLLFHLGLVNVIIAAFFLGGIAPNFFKEKWSSEASCTFVGTIWRSLHIVMLWTVTAINLDKYITISSPLHYNRFVTVKKACAFLIISWMSSTVITIPPLILSTASSSAIRSTKFCTVEILNTSKFIGLGYTIFFNLFAFILPIFLVAVVNSAILVIARHHRHRIITALWDVTISAQATVTQQNSQFYLNKYRGRSAASTILHHIGTLICVYLPSVTCDLYEAIAKEKLPFVAHMTSFSLLALSPSINGFVYGVKSKILRKRFMGVLRRQLYKSEVSCEIQERVPPSSSGSRRSSITPSIALPFQRQLTRRMSGILQPGTNSANNTSEVGGDTRPRLIRQSSELSCKFRSQLDTSLKHLHSSEQCLGSSLVKDSSDAVGQHKPIALLSSPLLKKPQSVQNASLIPFDTCKAQSIFEMTENIYNGGHRQSLRRCLFAKNKQKSLDLNNANKEEKHPPRSVSHQLIKEELGPSTARPLMLPTDPLTPTKRVKKVSWSYDSVTTSDMSTQNSPFESETDNESLSFSFQNKGGLNKLKGRKGDLKKHSPDRPDSEFQRNLSSVINRKKELSHDIHSPFCGKSIKKLHRHTKGDLQSPLQEQLSPE